MASALLWLAKRIYFATPWRRVRQFYFDAFALLMRNRRAAVDLDGMRFDLDLGESIDLRLFLRQFEPEVVAALRRETKPGMTAVDIGANIGAHTMLLATLVGPAGRVLAFEPTDYAWKKLQRNLALNNIPWITSVKAALSDEPADGRAVDFRASWRTEGGRRGDGTSIVDFIRLDDWCRDHGVARIDIVKIDVDGNEYPVLTGALEILSRSLPVFVMEAGWPHFADASRNPFLLLEGMGYTFRDLFSGKRLQLDELRSHFPEYDPGMTQSTNILAEPPGRA